MKTLESVRKEAEELLQTKNILDPEIDAWYLMEYFFDITRVNYMMQPSREVSDDEYKGYMNIINQRADGKPLQYITGIQAFMGFNFRVNENVLIPRQDTELLVEEALKICEGKSVLDLCTGSGCIIISLCKLSALNKAVGSDISEKAAETARGNARRHSADVLIIQGDLFENIKGRFDIIVSNPPYIESDIIPGLMKEVREHEPLGALDGGDDGLIFYRRIVKDSRDYLNRHGHILFEIGYNQGKEVSRLLEQEGFMNIRVIKDLAGHDRVVIGCLMPQDNESELHGGNKDV